MQCRICVSLPPGSESNYINAVDTCLWCMLTVELAGIDTSMVLWVCFFYSEASETFITFNSCPPSDEANQSCKLTGWCKMQLHGGKRSDQNHLNLLERNPPLLSVMQWSGKRPDTNLLLFLDLQRLSRPNLQPPKRALCRTTSSTPSASRATLQSELLSATAACLGERGWGRWLRFSSA